MEGQWISMYLLFGSHKMCEYVFVKTLPERSSAPVVPSNIQQMSAEYSDPCGTPETDGVFKRRLDRSIGCPHSAHSRVLASVFCSHILLLHFQVWHSCLSYVMMNSAASQYSALKPLIILGPSKINFHNFYFMNCKTLFSLLYPAFTSILPYVHSQCLS